MKEIKTWQQIKPGNFTDEIDMQIISSKSSTVSKVKCLVPTKIEEHSHFSEQISYVVTGEIIVTFNDRKRYLKPGDVSIIPSNVKHSAEIVKCPFEGIDIFTPVREDYVACCIS